ncbi:MAG: hypothetical protein HY550_09860 [Elusimicrobia bacterium]|nr:hypothetical protein [Elusimicrobiota bacterium]
MNRTLPAFLLFFSVCLSALPASAASGAGGYFGGGDGTVRGLVSGLRAGGAELPKASAPEKVSIAAEQTAERNPVNGYLAKVEGVFHISSNLYFTHKGESYLLENFTGLHKYSLRSRDLYASIRDAGDFRLGTMNLDPAALKEGERAPFELLTGFETSLVHYKWKLPKVDYVFAAGITGFGWVRQVTERTERIISLKTPEGAELCYYENIPGKVKGALYAGKAGCR